MIYYMEKSSFEKIIGKASEEDKEGSLQYFGKRFKEQKFEAKIEREKTKEEIEMISMANVLTNETRRKYGLDDFNIPPENIHIIKKEYWNKVEKNSNLVGHYTPISQDIDILEDNLKMNFMHNLIHELLHFKSYQALRISNDEFSNIEIFRAGLVVNKLEKKGGSRKIFSNLNEAVTEETTRRFVINRIVKYKPVLFKEEIENKVASIYFYYKEQRLILSSLIYKIKQKNEDKFQNREEIFDIFEGAMITGRLGELKRLIDNTFGAGTFKKLAELDQDLKKEEEFIENL